jgi:trehalose/maltose hydrolase-like predicted phosphorylase
MARWNLERAAALDAGARRAHNVADAEVAEWCEIAGGLVDGYDANSQIFEQFAGFHDLEPLVIEEVAPRRPIAADLLLGAARVRGAQVLKQADVLMLHHLVPDAVPAASLAPNLAYYEPRTAHGSSLSPAIHASLFARVCDFTSAADALHIASRIDLDDLTQSTTGGLHLATMGGLWQALVFGYAGIRPNGSALTIDPHVPAEWGALEICVRFRESRVHTRMTHDQLVVDAEPEAVIEVGGHRLTAGADVRFAFRNSSWEVIS